MEDFLFNNEFVGKHIVVVGANCEIGRLAAESFLDFGAKVSVVDIDPVLSEWSNQKSKINSCHILDVNDELDLEKLVQDLGPSVSGLIYLPRARNHPSLSELTEENFLDDMRIGLLGAILTSRALFTLMSKNRMHDPFILFMSSVLSRMVSNNESVGYHIAKAGIEHLARYFASEFGVHGIRVNAISPGWLVKDQHKELFYSEENSDYRHSVELTHLLNPIGSIEDIVDAMLFLGSKRSKFITGQTINVDGGLGIKEPGSMILGKNRHATK